jgi:hypothetical protein
MLFFEALLAWPRDFLGVKGFRRHFYPVVGYGRTIARLCGGRALPLVPRYADVAALFSVCMTRASA